MKYPDHVGLIPDGNRTWARENGKSSLEGHLTGLTRGIELIEYTFSKTPIKAFTARGLSTENLKERSSEELEYLFMLYKKVNDDLNSFLSANNINFKRIGNRHGLPEHLLSYLDNQVTLHQYKNSEKYLISAINYGGRDEIIRAINKAGEAGYNTKEITEEILSEYTDIAGLPRLDFVIRTKGDLAHRTSGFMSWHIGYAELFFTDKKCPDFTTEQYQQALERYDKVYEHKNHGK